MTWEERFWSKVRKTNDCWEWQAGRQSGGYGQFFIQGRGGPQLAHRVSYELANGRPIPAGMCVLHRCDNPPCVNPDHLRLGTQTENRADCVAKGRHSVPTTPAGIENPRAKLTARDCRAIRVLRDAGVTRVLLAEAFDVHPKTITAAGGSYLIAHIEANRKTAA